ncbi:hypothetical protein L1887_53041 [Cichorium endivia]|nr:hypothetical protein L1887_53041 [Cichorium endivia]
MREQRIRLYIVPGVKENTKFETLTRKEISKIAWFRLSDLPTWKKSKDPPAGMGGKFYLISPFIGRLKQWIHNNKASHSGQPAGKPGACARCGPCRDLADRGPHQTKHPRPPSRRLWTRPRSSPSFSGEDKAAQKPSEPLPAPPTSDKLKSLLGLSSPASEPARAAMPDASNQQDQARVFEQMFPGVGAHMIQASGDERGQQLLSLLMNQPNAGPQASAAGRLPAQPSHAGPCCISAGGLEWAIFSERKRCSTRTWRSCAGEPVPQHAQRSISQRVSSARPHVRRSLARRSKTRRAGPSKPVRCAAANAAAILASKQLSVASLAGRKQE